jgi:hypothetical protein
MIEILQFRDPSKEEVLKIMMIEEIKSDLMTIDELESMGLLKI